MVAFRKTLLVSLTVGFILSLTLWLVVKVNGDFEENGASSFMPRLIHMQQTGINTATAWFPCTGQSSQGCEPYKIVPAIIVVNGIVYSAILLLPIFLIRKWTTTLD